MNAKRGNYTHLPEREASGWPEGVEKGLTLFVREEERVMPPLKAQDHRVFPKAGGSSTAIARPSVCRARQQEKLVERRQALEEETLAHGTSKISSP